jgi:hypothetical protein
MILAVSCSACKSVFPMGRPVKARAVALYRARVSICVSRKEPGQRLCTEPRLSLFVRNRDTQASLATRPAVVHGACNQEVSRYTVHEHPRRLHDSQQTAPLEMAHDHYVFTHCLHGVARLVTVSITTWHRHSFDFRCAGYSVHPTGRHAACWLTRMPEPVTQPAIDMALLLYENCQFYLASDSA